MGNDTEILRRFRRRDYYDYRHHQRYVKYVYGNGMTCQDCGGAGGYKEVILDDGSGPWYGCGWCEGTGLVTRWLRGQWLRYMREEKRKKSLDKKN